MDNSKLWLLIVSISVIGLLTILNLHFSLEITKWIKNPEGVNQLTQQIKNLETVNQELFAKMEKKDLSEIIPAILSNQQKIYEQIGQIPQRTPPVASPIQP